MGSSVTPPGMEHEVLPAMEHEVLPTMEHEAKPAMEHETPPTMEHEAKPKTGDKDLSRAEHGGSTSADR